MYVTPLWPQSDQSSLSTQRNQQAHSDQGSALVVDVQIHGLNFAGWQQVHSPFCWSCLVPTRMQSSKSLRAPKYDGLNGNISDYLKI